MGILFYNEIYLTKLYFYQSEMDWATAVNTYGELKVLKSKDPNLDKIIVLKLVTVPKPNVSNDRQIFARQQTILSIYFNDLALTNDYAFYCILSTLILRI